MILKLKNSYLFITALVFCFLAPFAFSIGDFVIPYYFILVGLFLTVNLVFLPKATVNKLIPFFKTNSAKYLGFLILWIILGILISTITGTFYLPGLIKNFFGNFFFSQIFPFLMVLIAVPYIVSFKKLSKILLIIYFCIFALGILEFIGNVYKISVINSIFSFLVTRASLLTDTERNIRTAFGFPRLSSIFQESSYFAWFILLNSPIIYNFCFSKNKLFNNSAFDFWFKKLTFFMMIFCFIFIQSPMFLFFALILLIIFGVKKGYKHRKKLLLYIPIVLFLIFISLIIANFAGFNFIAQINLMETFIRRIIIVLNNFSSMQGLVLLEPSLATRIENFAAQFNTFLHHPVFGVGYGNINSVWYKEVLKLPFPITPELYEYALRKEQLGGASMLFKFLSETGIVGTTLLYLFLFNLLYSLNKKLQMYQGISKELLTGLKFSLIILICLSFYDTYQNVAVTFVYLGLIQSMVINYNFEENNIK